MILEALEAVLGGHEGRGGAALREHGWSFSGFRQHGGLCLRLELGCFGLIRFRVLEGLFRV